jgi:hypothetical protein
MRQKYWTRLSRVLLVFAVVVGVSAIPSIASASCTGTLQSCSTTYGVDNTYFGSGGQECIPGTNGSTNYCANMGVGDLTVGNPTSSHYQAHTGSALDTNREPSIALSVGGASTYLGDLKTSCTTVTTGNFSVKTYLASGYTVVTDAAPPTAASHTLSTPSTPTTPSAGTEQFGMNVVANSGMSPANCDTSTSIGANPSQNPDSTFSFGAAATSAQNANTDSYNTNDKFMYNNGDVIAYSNSSSGETDYTISYIFNISNLTPTGNYVFNDVLVATSTY